MMNDRGKVIRGLENCIINTRTLSKALCDSCPYEKAPFPCTDILMKDALAMLKEQEAEIKGLRKLVEWAVECDFGYDYLGDWWVDRFKSEIEGMSYTEGLIHLAKRYVEVFEGGDSDA